MIELTAAYELAKTFPQGIGGFFGSIAGGFVEHTPEGSFRRNPGDIVHRKATDPHWLELEPGYQSISLFFTGPKIREWGFHCPKGWQHWHDFTGGYHDGRSQKGAGCGEYA